MSRLSTPFIALLGVCLLGASACKSSDDPAAGAAGDAAGAEAGAEAKADADAGAGEAEAPAEADATQTAAKAELEQLLAWLTPEPLAVAYDRMTTRLDPHAVEAVFAIPPRAGDLLDERATLDEGLDIVFDGDAEASNWLGETSLAFTVALSKSPYFVRPLTRPAAEVAPLLEQGGFTKNTIEGFEIWLPDGSFPWRIALLDNGAAAFIPLDVPGAGVEPLAKAREAEPSSIETELAKAFADDGTIELILIAGGPLIHFDIGQSINQVQFALRKIPTGGKPAYEGMIQLVPSGDPDEAANTLRGRSHPEENQQIQSLMASVEFQVAEGAIAGRMEIPPDQLKHFIDR